MAHPNLIKNSIPAYFIPGHFSLPHNPPFPPQASKILFSARPAPAALAAQQRRRAGKDAGRAAAAALAEEAMLAEQRKTVQVCVMFLWMSV